MSCLRYYSDCALCWHYLYPFRYQYVRCKHAVLGITQCPTDEVNMFEEQDRAFSNMDSFFSDVLSDKSEPCDFTTQSEAREASYPCEPVLVLAEPAPIPSIDGKRGPSREIISIKIVGREKRILVRDNSTGIISVIRKPI
jgi:hypothetical protein